MLFQNFFFARHFTILTPNFVLTHFLLPTCCSDPPAVKLNWCPPHDEYKPSTTPSDAAPIGCTHFPLLVCFRLPFSRTNSNLLNSEVKLTHFKMNDKYKKEKEIGFSLRKMFFNSSEAGKKRSVSKNYHFVTSFHKLRNLIYIWKVKIFLIVLPWYLLQVFQTGPSKNHRGTKRELRNPHSICYGSLWQLQGFLCWMVHVALQKPFPHKSFQRLKPLEKLTSLQFWRSFCFQ